METLAELPFIGDQVVCLSHDQAVRSGAARSGTAPPQRPAGSFLGGFRTPALSARR